MHRRCLICALLLLIAGMGGTAFPQSTERRKATQQAINQVANAHDVEPLSWVLVIPEGGVDLDEEDRPRVSAGEIGFIIDTAGFRAEEGHTYEEIYLQLPLDQVSFVERDGRLEAVFQIEVVLDNEQGEIARGTWTRRAVATSFEGVGMVLDVFPFTLGPGEYGLSIRVRDIHTEREGQHRGTLRVPSFVGTELMFSQIQFGMDIEPAQEGKFVKSGQRITPNLTRSFSTETSVLYAYVEVYNLASGGSSDDSFDLRYTVLDRSGGIQKRYPVKRIRKPGRTGAKGEALDLGDLPPGAYVLQVEMRDRLSGQQARVERRFQIMEPPLVVFVRDQDLETFHDQIRYIATPKELGIYQSLEPLGKIQFVQAFWREKDPTPGTPENEFLSEHLRRMDYVDAHFGYLSRRGLDTDRGRIYIQYGPPDDILQEVMASENKPTETWVYDKYGQRICVFRDRRGTGIYELVHSTIIGEPHNPLWEEAP